MPSESSTDPTPRPALSTGALTENVGSMPSAAALAISRSCSASSTEEASSISMTGMPSRTS